MATTSIWSVKKRLDHVLTYITNPDKTTKESYKELHKTSEYENATYETEEQLYVTAINCSEDSMYDDMMRTKKRFNKTDGILRLSRISIICRRRSYTRSCSRDRCKTCK